MTGIAARFFPSAIVDPVAGIASMSLLASMVLFAVIALPALRGAR